MALRTREKDGETARDEEDEQREERSERAGEEEREREIEGPGVGPEGYVGAAPRPEAARHLGHPYIGKYSRVEKAPLYLKPVLSLLSGSGVS